MDYLTSGRSGQTYQVGQPLGGLGSQFYRGFNGAQEVLLRLATSANDIAALRTEAAWLDQLTHPQIVRLLDRGRSESLNFLVLEGPAERPLAELINQTDLAPTAALDIVVQVLTVLEAMHAAGIVWGRLRPQAFWVDKAGRLKLYDLSHAGEPISAATLTLAEALYIAPEHAAEAQPAVPGDVYAVGALAYELLAGRPPFAGGDITELAVKHLSEPAPDLQRVRSDLPSELTALIGRCLAKQPEQRPASAAALRAEMAVFHEQLVAAEQARMITCARCQGRVLPAERCPLCNAPLVAPQAPVARKPRKLLPLLAIGASLLVVIVALLNLGGENAAASALPTIPPTSGVTATALPQPTSAPTPLPTAAAAQEAPGSIRVAADDVADANIDLFQAQVAIEKNTVTAELSVAGVIDQQVNTATYQFFFDTDGNAATGDTSAPWAGMGADYTALYRSGDASAMLLRWDGTTWQAAGAATTTIAGGALRIQIPSERLNAPKTIHFAVLTTKPGANLADYAPARGAAAAVAGG